MTITIHYTNGTSTTYTECTTPTLVDGVYSFTGKNSAGVTVVVKANWANIQSVEEQGAG